MSALRLRTAQSQRPASENASRLLGRGWAGSIPYANEGRNLPGKNRLCLPDLEETRRNPQLLSTSSDVVDVPFKSGRAGALRGNANLGCYTTAGGLFSLARPPGSLSASPPLSPPPQLPGSLGPAAAVAVCSSFRETPSSCSGRPDRPRLFPRAASEPSVSARRPT